MNIGERLRALTDQLPELDGRWREAMQAVPRHRFIPDRAWCHPDKGSGYLIDRAEDPDAWLSAVYSDAAIVTQIDEGGTEVGEGIGEYTSSSSAPGVVAAELGLLDPYEGDEVLEIGTGTGWTAGLLAHRLGAANITSIEIDQAVFAVAADNLKALGIRPHLLLADGADGWQEGAPYDRVHVTCGVSEVPYEWVKQTRLGGLIVLPWTPRWEGGYLARFTVVGDGSAVGRFHRGIVFMPLRSQRWEKTRAEGDYRRSSTLLDPRRVAWSPMGADIAIAGLLPDLYGAHVNKENGEFHLRVWTEDSEAQAHYSPDYKRVSVFERGPRALWNELEAAYFQWVSWGAPERDRFGMTVLPQGQYVWLDSPDNPLKPVDP